MKLKRFNINKHYDELCVWLSVRKHPIPTRNEIPKIGYIAFEGTTPVAVAFIRRIEGLYGQIDGLASNPSVQSLVRNKALNLVIAKVIEKAKQLKIKGLISTTKDCNTLMRSLSHGFVELPYTVVGLNLQGVSTPGAD